MNIYYFAVQHGITAAAVYYALKREGIPIESIKKNRNELTDEGVEILNCIYSRNADDKTKLKKMRMRMGMRDLRAEAEKEMTLLNETLDKFKKTDVDILPLEAQNLSDPGTGIVNEIMEFVKHLPYETHLHSVQEARDVLCHWRDELPEQILEQIPDGLDAVRFFEAHVLHEAGYDDINLDCVWINTTCDNDVYFNIDDITFCLRVWPDGIYVRHKGNKWGCIWTDFERVTQ